MDLKKVIVHIMLGITFVGVGFLCGYLLGNLLYTPRTEPAKEILLPQEVAEPSATPDNAVFVPDATSEAIAQNCFLVQSVGNSIYIYEISDTQKTPVKAFDVNIDMFPNTDREILREGISVPTIQNAYEIIENFTS